MPDYMIYLVVLVLFLFYTELKRTLALLRTQFRRNTHFPRKYIDIIILTVILVSIYCLNFFFFGQPFLYQTVEK